MPDLRKELHLSETTPSLQDIVQHGLPNNLFVGSIGEGIMLQVLLGARDDEA